MTSFDELGLSNTMLHAAKEYAAHQRKKAEARKRAKAQQPASRPSRPKTGKGGGKPRSQAPSSSMRKRGGTQKRPRA